MFEEEHEAKRIHDTIQNHHFITKENVYSIET